MRIVPWLLGVLLISGCGARGPVVVHGQPVHHWVEALRDNDPKAREKAVAALGNVGTADPEVLPALTGAVKDRDVRVRSAAILALLRIGPDAREAVPALREATRDRNTKVRLQAARALERIEGGK